MTIAISMRGVDKSYRDAARTVEVLRAIDLAVEGGERLAIVGPSGSGKSTLLHILGTLDRPTSGAVRIAGRDIGALGERELAAFRAHEIGFVFQQFFLLDGPTIAASSPRATRRSTPRSTRTGPGYSLTIPASSTTASAPTGSTGGRAAGDVLGLTPAPRRWRPRPRRR